jgi:hypothetical protein
MKKRFIPQLGSNNTVKIFNVETGQLHRVVNIEGEIISGPFPIEDEMYVTVKRGTGAAAVYYSLANGSLKKIQPI